MEYTEWTKWRFIIIGNGWEIGRFHPVAHHQAAATAAAASPSLSPSSRFAFGTRFHSYYVFWLNENTTNVPYSWAHSSIEREKESTPEVLRINIVFSWCGLCGGHRYLCKNVNFPMLKIYTKPINGKTSEREDSKQECLYYVTTEIEFFHLTKWLFGYNQTEHQFSLPTAYPVLLPVPPLKIFSHKHTHTNIQPLFYSQFCDQIIMIKQKNTCMLFFRINFHLPDTYTCN